MLREPTLTLPGPRAPRGTHSHPSLTALGLPPWWPQEGHGRSQGVRVMQTPAKWESRARQGFSRGRPADMARGTSLLPCFSPPRLDSELTGFPVPTCGAQGCYAKAPRHGPVGHPIGQGWRGDGASPFPAGRGSFPWTPQALGTAKLPRKPPELGRWWRRKAGRLPPKRRCVWPCHRASVVAGAAGPGQKNQQLTGPPGWGPGHLEERGPCHMTHGHNSVSGESGDRSAGPRALVTVSALA